MVKYKTFYPKITHEVMLFQGIFMDCCGWTVPKYGPAMLVHLLLSVFLLLIPVSLSAGQNIPAGQLTVRYAKGFQVEYRDAVTLVTVTNPWPGAKTGFCYLLKKRGAVTPPGYDDCQVVEIPVKRLISLSTTVPPP
ncbi:MAG: hypothetical protein L3J49_11850 [Desulfobulbaceae bacterium]|nr:hypothetical protein [Desulfobulbaceae bacterium]